MSNGSLTTASSIHLTILELLVIIMIQCFVAIQAQLSSTILLEHMKVFTLAMLASLTAFLAVTVFMYLLKT